MSVFRSRRPFRSRVVAVSGAIFLIASSCAFGGDYAVRNGTIAGGGGTSEAGQFRLIGTIAEPAQGPMSNGSFRLTAGFPATIGDPRPVEPFIFKDGFEN